MEPAGYSPSETRTSRPIEAGNVFQDFRLDSNGHSFPSYHIGKTELVGLEDSISGEKDQKADDEGVDQQPHLRGSP